EGWRAIAEGRDALIAAPTGSGKTLAAFLSSIDSLLKRGLDGSMPEGIDVVYVSPLKALSSDIQRNLEAPLAGIREVAGELGPAATVHPIEEAARFLVGVTRIARDGTPDCAVVNVGHRRDIDLRIEVPPTDLQAVASHEQWGEIYDRLAELIAEHRTTLVFVNT